MMKKIIALALALSMALSMVAFAGYTDAALVNTDLNSAVELVGALGLMTGNPDGSFNPKGTLTRGEAAVIVYRLSAGKKDIDASWGDASLNSFTDMAGHWSAPYVNYCAALGLILGDPAGTFRPNDAVTAVEMAKMLLNAAGYDTEKQGYGKNWPAAVLADATNAGLFADFEAAYTAPAAREWVAKLVANLMDVNTVSYNVYTDKLVVGEKSFGAEKYALASFTGIVKNTDTFGLDDATKNSSGYSTVGTTTIKYDLANSMLNHRVTVYFQNKDASVDGDGKATYTGTEKVYAVVDKSTTLTTTLDKLTVTEADATTGAIYLCVDGAKTSTLLNKGTLTTTQTLLDEVYINFDYDNTKVPANLLSDTAIADSREITLIDNDGKTGYDAIMMNAVKFFEITAFDATAKTLTLNSSINVAQTGTAIDWDDVVFVDEVAEDDIIRVEHVINAKGELKYEVSKVNALRTKVASATASTFTVNGVVYEAAVNAYVPGFNMTSFISNNLATSSNLKNNTIDIYTDGKYVVYASLYSGDAATGLPSNVAYLISKNTTDGTTFAEAAKVQVLFADGTVAIYEYKAPSTGAVAWGDALALDVVYEYVLNDDGTVYFKTISAAGNGKLDNDATAFSFTGNVGKSYFTVQDSGDVNAYMTADTYFFYKLQDGSETDYGVVKASELPKSVNTTSGGVTTYNVNYANYAFSKFAFTKDTDSNLYSLVYGVLTSTTDVDGELPVGGATGSTLFIVTEVAEKVVTADGDSYKVTGLNMNGEAQTLTLRSDKVGGTGDVELAANTVYVIKTDADGKYLASASGELKNSFANRANGKWVNVDLQAATNDVVMIDGNLYDVADNAVILYIYDADTAVDAKEVAVKESGVPTVIPHGASNVYVKTSVSGSTTTISSIIIGVTSKTSNTQVDVDTLLGFANPV